MSRFQKKYKVRRFGQIYPSRRSTPSIVLRTVLTITVVCVLSFVGWNAYGPVRDYFTGALAAAAHQSETPPPSSVPEESEPAPDPAPEPEPEPPAQLRAAYVPVSVLSDAAQLNVILDGLTEQDVNTVLFDLKDASGTVYFQSGNDLVIDAEAVSKDAVDLRDICRRLTQRGFIPAGRLSVFADPIASARLADAGVKYMNTNMQWLDNSLENGGKGWLNPYSDTARQYLTSLVSEAASQGIRRIVLDQFSFPIGVGMEFANFGEKAETVARADALSRVIQALEQAAGAQDCVLSLYVSGMAALDAQNDFYGGLNPLELSADVIVDVMPAQFGDGYASETLTLEQPVMQPYETVKALLQRLSSTLSGKQVCAMIQGYTATGALENNKVYTKADIEEQLRALQECGIPGYILYSPDGIYPAD